jgi:hypothetical protein
MPDMVAFLLITGSALLVLGLLRLCDGLMDE